MVLLTPHRYSPIIGTGRVPILRCHICGLVRALHTKAGIRRVTEIIRNV